MQTYDPESQTLNPQAAPTSWPWTPTVLADLQASCPLSTWREAGPPNHSTEGATEGEGQAGGGSWVLRPV